MRNKTFLFILTSLWSVSIYSQIDTTTSHKMGWIIQSGVRYCNLQMLNTTFENNGISLLNNQLWGYSIGLTSRSISKNSYGSVTLSSFGANDDGMQTQTLSPSIDIVELAFRSQLALTNSPKWLVFPYIGYGDGYGSMKITDKNQTTTFAESIADLKQNDGTKKRYPMEYPYAFATFGIGIDRGIKLASHQLFIGLSSGYNLATKSGWGYPNLPSVGYRGFE